MLIPKQGVCYHTARRPGSYTVTVPNGMAASLPQIVRDRAAGRCEYCRLPQAATSVPFEIDHIISRKHHGPMIASNLANACWYCNTFKGSDISGLARFTYGLLARIIL